MLQQAVQTQVAVVGTSSNVSRVRPTVAIEVTNRKSRWTRPKAAERDLHERLESSISIAQKVGEAVVSIVRSDDVDFPVGIQIDEPDVRSAGRWIIRITHACLESSVPIPKANVQREKVTFESRCRAYRRR